MPDTEEVKKTVDLDTSGPAMDVDIPEKLDENEIVEKETVKEEPTVRPVEDEKIPEDKTFENERETKLDQKDDTELKYSESVQRRIAKLTKNGEKQNVKKTKLFLMLKTF